VSYFASFFSPARATNFARRDFLRDAVFALMTPRLAALSIALYAAESFAVALAISPAVALVRTAFTVSVSARLRRTLNTYFRALALFAFFAELVIAICISI
jgi:hypothetical protein